MLIFFYFKNILSYMIAHHKYTAAGALEFIRERRSCVQPNFSYLLLIFILFYLN